MSVINQVLNQLEQRGARTPVEQGAVRAVPHGKRKSAVPLLVVVGLAVVAGIAAWQWMQARKPDAGSIAPEAGGSRSVSEPEKRASQPPPAGVLAEKLAPDTGAVSGSGATDLGGKPVQPAVSGVSPNPASATGTPQPLVISGSNFAVGSTVALRTPDGRVYAARPISSRSATQIVINPNFGKSSGTWTVEVSGPGGAPPALFAFAVQAPPAAAEQGSGQPPAHPEPARGTPEADSPLPAKAGTELTTPAEGGKAAVDVPPGGEGKPMKQVSPAQQADAEYRKATASMQRGRTADAVAGYESALRLDAAHDAARQALVALLLEGKRGADAERVLGEGLKSKPEHTGFAMLLARLQVERGADDQAVATLEKLLPHAGSQADFRAFLAALLQRQKRHSEAISHYRIALQTAPTNGVWLMGYGISLQAEQRTDDAKDAFNRALESKTLNPELQEFVKQRLKGL